MIEVHGLTYIVTGAVATEKQRRRLVVAVHGVPGRISH